MSAVVQPLPRPTDSSVPATARGELVVTGLGKRYGSAGSEVLRDVSFSLRVGERVAVLGANGSGKSTMLRCCLRLIDPSRGRVELFGQDLTACDRRSLCRMRAQVGFVSQRHNLVPRLSVLSNVLHGAQGRVRGPRVWFQALARESLRAEAMECLQQVGLAALAGRRADRLSGGQSQRVAIARALMQRPRLVFADEPVASLDPAAGQEVMELLTSLMRAHGVGVLFTTHDLRQIRRFADRVIALRGGVLVLDQPTDRVGPGTLHGLYAQSAS